MKLVCYCGSGEGRDLKDDVAPANRLESDQAFAHGFDCCISNVKRDQAGPKITIVLEAA